MTTKKYIKCGMCIAHLRGKALITEQDMDDALKKSGIDTDDGRSWYKTTLVLEGMIERCAGGYRLTEAGKGESIIVVRVYPRKLDVETLKRVKIALEPLHNIVDVKLKNADVEVW